MINFYALLVVQSESAASEVCYGTIDFYLEAANIKTSQEGHVGVIQGRQ
jgi:hypothetical protein